MSELKDMTGTKCLRSKKCGGVYKETNLLDDMDGVLHCSKCGHKISRYKTYEPNA